MLKQLRDGSAARLYPLCALVCALIWFFCGLFFVKQFWFPYYLASLLLLLVAAGYGRVLLRIQLPLILLCLLLVLLAALSATWQQALQNGLRVYLLATTAVLTLTIHPVALLRILEAHQLPSTLSLGVLITLRFFTVLTEEFRRIHLASRLRGLPQLGRRPSFLLRSYLLPLLARLFSLSDQLSMSLEIRGFAKELQRSQYRLERPRLRDLGFLVLTLLINGGGFYVNYIKA